MSFRSSNVVQMPRKSWVLQQNDSWISFFSRKNCKTYIAQSIIQTIIINQSKSTVNIIRLIILKIQMLKTICRKSSQDFQKSSTRTAAFDKNLISPKIPFQKNSQKIIIKIFPAQRVFKKSFGITGVGNNPSPAPTSQTGSACRQGTWHVPTRPTRPIEMPLPHLSSPYF